MSSKRKGYRQRGLAKPREIDRFTMMDKFSSQEFSLGCKSCYWSFEDSFDNVICTMHGCFAANYCYEHNHCTEYEFDGDHKCTTIS